MSSRPQAFTMGIEFESLDVVVSVFGVDMPVDITGRRVQPVDAPAFSRYPDGAVFVFGYLSRYGITESLSGAAAALNVWNMSFFGL